MPAFFDKLSALYREFGPAAGSLYLADRLLQSVSPSMRIFVYELMVQPIQHTFSAGRSIEGQVRVAAARVFARLLVEPQSDAGESRVAHAIEPQSPGRYARRIHVAAIREVVARHAHPLRSR